MKIHAIQTGTVAITTAWREGVGHGRRRLLHTILDRNWTEPLPIYAFAIEHPEGVHLHTDHAGGLHHFPDTEILVARPEIAYATGPRGQLRGYPNKRWPSWFDPTPLDLEPVSFGPFPQRLHLTEAGDVTLVPVPGHSPGQLGVLVEDGDHTVFLAGDSSYTQELLLRGTVDGVGPDEQAERITHQRIRAYAAANPTVYLVAHDPDTEIRLAERRLIQPVTTELAA